MLYMTRILTFSAAAALLAAGPAAAQIAGGLGGQVTGGVSGRIDRPAAGAVAGQVGDAVRDARDLTRGTISSDQDLARDAAPGVDAEAEANVRAGLRTGRDEVAVDAALQTGAAVRSSDGVDLGRIVEVTRNEAGRAVHFLVRSADGAVRMVPAGAVSLEGGVLVTGSGESQFGQRPSGAPGRAGESGADRR
jgi:hypothetical protein